MTPAPCSNASSDMLHRSVTYTALGLFAAIAVGGLLPTGTVHAQGLAGWYHPSVHILGQDASCGIDKTNYMVRLKEYNSDVDISDPSGLKLTVDIYNNSNNQLLRQHTFSDTAHSDFFCFDPVREMIRPKVEVTSASAQYWPAGDVAVGFEAGSPRASLGGFSVEGYVHLLPASVAVPDTAIDAPKDSVPLSGEPSYYFTINRLTPLYETTEVTDTTVYWKNVGSGTIRKRVFSTSMTPGSYMLSPQGLSDGVYDWYFHHKANGTITNLYNALALEFTRLPESSLTKAARFRIDTHAPGDRAITNSRVGVVGNEETRDIRARYKDANSGLDYIHLRVREQGSSVNVATSTCYYWDGVSSRGYFVGDRTCSLDPSDNRTEYETGKTYELFVAARDIAGNVSTYSEVFTPKNVPTVSGLSHTLLDVNNVRFSANVTNEGSSPILERGFSYRMEGESTWTYVTEGSAVLGLYTHEEYGLPSGDYEYRARVRNGDGWGQSDVKTFSLGPPVAIERTHSPDRWCWRTQSRVSVHYNAPGGAEAYKIWWCETPTCSTGCVSGTSDTRIVVDPYYTGSPVAPITQYRYSANDNTCNRFWAAPINAGVTGARAFVGGLTSYDCSPREPVLDSPEWDNHGVVASGTREVEFRARVTDGGNDDLLDVGVCWGTSEADARACMHVASATPPAGRWVRNSSSYYTFSVFDEIPDGQQVWYMMYAENVWNYTGTTTVRSFVVGAERPTLDDTAHTLVTYSMATMGANVTNRGGAPLTHRGTEWCSVAPEDDGTCPGLSGGGYPPCGLTGSNRAWQAEGDNVGPYFHTRTGLPDGSCVYYRGVARNLAGLYGYSPISWFKIDPAPPGAEGDVGTPVLIPQ